jgi:hypothetical protein
MNLRHSLQRPALIAGLALAGFAATGHAAVVSLAAQAFNLGTTQAGSGSSNAAQTLSFAGFDSTLGTLTQVRLIRVDDDRYVRARAEGTPLIPEVGARFTDDASATFSLKLGTQSLDNLDMLVANAECEDQGAFCPGTILAAMTADVTTQAGTLGSVVDLLGPALAAFISSTPLSLDFGIELSNLIGSSGGITSNTSFGESNWFGSLAIEYTYDAAPTTGVVPEPPVLALAGLALAGLALSRRRA